VLSHDDRIQTLIEAERIQEKVRELAARITADYRGTPFTVLGVLKGSVFFLVDLLKSVPIPLQLEFLRASSYGDRTTSSGTVALGPFESSLAGRHVLIVDDILDSGRTLATIAAAVRATGAASVRTCVLIDKKKPRAMEHEAHYSAFEIPDVFIVGYGLDYAEHYRNLPYIAVLPPEVYGGA
jgi:hypoxanthine phosphoribosyltransferase